MWAQIRERKFNDGKTLRNLYIAKEKNVHEMHCLLIHWHVCTYVFVMDENKRERHGRKRWGSKRSKKSAKEAAAKPDRDELGGNKEASNGASRVTKGRQSSRGKVQLPLLPHHPRRLLQVPLPQSFKYAKA